MDEQKLINKFIELCEGNFTPEYWKVWFSENAENVEKICGRRYFLKIKPSPSFSDINNIYKSQTAAFDWLNSKNISITLSDVYKKNYEIEFDNFRKAQNEKRNLLKKSVETNFSYLKEIYPKLLRQLSKSYDEFTKIELGKSTAEIDLLEKELAIQFSDELKTFFSTISVFEFEGIEINFNNIEKQFFDNKEFLVLGEFWIYGDGDKLLYDISNQSIVVFAHEYNPPKFIKKAKTMTEFVEKNLVKYLKENE